MLNFYALEILIQQFLLKNLKAGRILLYVPDLSLIMGATTAESEGFFNLDDTPPWDTWVSFLANKEHGDVIICWVPPQFEYQANEGIKVSPDECISWADEIDKAVIVTYLKESLFWPVLNEFLTYTT